MLLAVQHVLFTIANLPSPTSKLFGVNRLLSFKLAPFGILFQYVNFAMPYLFKTLQKYKLICNPPNKKPKIFVFLTFYNK